MESQHLIMNQILDKSLIELCYTERSVFRKDVNTNNDWLFEIGHSGDSTSTHIVVGFQARTKIESQLHNNSTFDQLQVSNAVCKVVFERHPADVLKCDYDRDNYHQAYHEIGNFSEYYSQTNLLIPFTSLQNIQNRLYLPSVRFIQTKTGHIISTY